MSAIKQKGPKRSATTQAEFVLAKQDVRAIEQAAKRIRDIDAQHNSVVRAYAIVIATIYVQIAKGYAELAPLALRAAFASLGGLIEGKLKVSTGYTYLSELKKYCLTVPGLAERWARGEWGTEQAPTLSQLKRGAGTGGTDRSSGQIAGQLFNTYDVPSLVDIIAHLTNQIERNTRTKNVLAKVRTRAAALKAKAAKASK